LTDRRSFPRALALVLGAFFALGLLLFSVSVAGATQPNPNHKVTLCHRTGSASNPYVEITVDIASSGYVKAGHTDHDQIGNGLGGDIIPAYQYVMKDGSVFNFPGKNLDTLILGRTGLTLLNNGCQLIATETPTPTPTETPEQSIDQPSSGTPDPSLDDLPNGAMSENGHLTSEGLIAVYAVLMTVMLGAGVLTAVDGRR